MRNISIIIILFLLPYFSFSQSTMSLDEATDALRAQNFQLQISKKNTTIAENNTSRLNRGFLPNIALNGGSQYSFGNAHTRYNALPDIDINGAGY